MCACPKLEPGLPTSYGIFVFYKIIWEVGFRFVDIVGIGDHHCLFVCFADIGRIVDHHT